MAASSSDDSSRAPDNFHISSSNGGCDSHLNNFSLKCPLCSTFRKNFYCKNCIRSGDFVHSAHHSPEKLSEKQQKYFNLQASLKKCNDRCNKLINNLKIYENLKFNIKQKQEKIALLNHLINNTKININDKFKYRETLINNNQLRKNILPKYEDKVRKLEDYVIDRLQQNTKLDEKKYELLNELQNKIRNDIQKLITYIFPISEIVIKDEQSIFLSSSSSSSSTTTATATTASTATTTTTVTAAKTDEIRTNLTTIGTTVPVKTVSDTIAALADAKNTSYIRGKWVFHGSGINEMQHCIVAPSLPANGDYSGYLDWLAENKDGVPTSTANEIVPSSVLAFRLMAALTYATQLVNLLSFYLNVRLPHKLAYGDFCKKLNEQQFTRRVSRLNTNIMYLAYTQHVKLCHLNENHTLENILVVLDTNKSDLGHFGHVDVSDAPLIRSIDSQVLLDLETGTESESEDENSLRLDWEAVPLHDSSPPLLPSNQQTASMAGGLMTSAVASVTSFFRGWTK